ncbi:MAG: TonB-dependent receptor [Cellvibrionaceae bacterium]
MAAKPQFKTLSFAVSSVVALSGAALSLNANAARVIEEITVTAQKRAESVQEVPIAIQAFSAESILNMGAQNVDDMGKFTPGLETNVTNETQPGYTIRGIPSASFGSGQDSSVGVYVDGVYVSRSGSALVNFADIERVEVLKGPQGTLFGRNATAGAISIYNKRPTAETEGEVKLTAGSHGRKDFSGIFNTALSNNLYMRAGVSIQRDDGIYDNATGPDLEQDDSQTYNLSFLYNGIENTEILWKLDYNELSIRNSSDISSNPTVNPEATTDNPQQGAFADRRTDVKPVENRELFGTTLIVDHDFSGNLSLKSITSYREFETNNLEDEDGGDNPFFFAYSDNIEEQDQISQEFILTYADEKLKWSAGFNYFEENIEQSHVIGLNRQTLEQFAISRILNNDAFAPALAAFGLSTDNLTQSSGYEIMTGTASPQLAGAWGAGVAGALAAAGFPPSGPLVPYMAGDGIGLFLAQNASTLLGTDDLAVIGPFVAGIAPAIGTGALGTVLDISDTVWEEITDNKGNSETLAIYGDFTYSFNDQWEVFAGTRYNRDERSFTVSTAYQNNFLGVPAGLAFFVPGTDTNSDSWSSLTSRLGVNFKPNEDVMFYLSAAEGFTAGGFNSFMGLVNGVPSAEVVPFEEEEVVNYELGMKSSWMGDRLQFNISFYSMEYENLQQLEQNSSAIPLYEVRNSDLDAEGFEFDVHFLATDNWLLSANYSHTETEYTKYGLLSGETTGDSKVGQPSTSVPEDKYNLFVEHTWEVSKDRKVITNLSYNHTDERSGTDANQTVDGYDVANLRVSYIPMNATWKVAAWSNNLFDEEYVYDIGGTGGSIGSAPVQRAPGRTWGVDVIYSF